MGVTDNQLHTIASLHLYGGLTIGQLAEKYGLTYGGMQHRLNSPKMKAIMAEIEAEIDIRSAVAKTYVQLQFPQYVGEISDIALDKDHKEQLKAAQYLTDKVWPTAQEVKVSTQLEGEALDQLNETFKLINEKMKGLPSDEDIENSPHLLEGEDAVPKPTQLDGGNE